jgi:hypothetical protein
MRPAKLVYQLPGSRGLAHLTRTDDYLDQWWLAPTGGDELGDQGTGKGHARSVRAAALFVNFTQSLSNITQ